MASNRASLNQYALAFAQIWSSGDFRQYIIWRHTLKVTNGDL